LWNSTWLVATGRKPRHNPESNPVDYNKYVVFPVPRGPKRKKLVRASLKHEGFFQVPQLKGSETNKKAGVFGIRLP
jgi:hypothetical protein